jgi:hypothetical protein
VFSGGEVVEPPVASDEVKILDKANLVLSHLLPEATLRREGGEQGGSGVGGQLREGAGVEDQALGSVQERPVEVARGIVLVRPVARAVGILRRVSQSRVRPQRKAYSPLPRRAKPWRPADPRRPCPGRQDFVSPRPPPARGSGRAETVEGSSERSISPQESHRPARERCGGTPRHRTPPGSPRSLPCPG